MNKKLNIPDGEIEGPGSTRLAYRLTGPLGPLAMTEFELEAQEEVILPKEPDKTTAEAVIPPSGMPWALRPRG